MPDYIKFVEELTALSEKYNIAIGGCGCCGSPYLYEIGDEQKPGNYSVNPYKKDRYEGLSWGKR